MDLTTEKDFGDHEQGQAAPAKGQIAAKGTAAGKGAAASKGERTGEVLDLDRYVPALITFIANKLSRSATTLYQKRFGVNVTEWRILSLLAIEPTFPLRASVTSSASTKARSAGPWR